LQVQSYYIKLIKRDRRRIKIWLWYNTATQKKAEFFLFTEVSHPSQAAEILDAAHRYVAAFRNPRLELATALLTLRRYFSL